jgi:hypothetical protein
MVHVLGETIQHAGHADILREAVDGRTGVRAENEQPIDEEARAAYLRSSSGRQDGRATQGLQGCPKT